MLRFHLLVIYTAQPERLKNQYAQLGIAFEYHRHGKGPYHYAAEMDPFVFEIYPATEDKESTPLRLGFELPNLDLLHEQLKQTEWKINIPPRETPWGYQMVITDLDGRKVELTAQ